MKTRDRLDYIDLMVYMITIIVMVSSFAMVVRDAAAIEFELNVIIYYCLIILLPIVAVRYRAKYALLVISAIMIASGIYLLKTGYIWIIINHTVSFFDWLSKYLSCNSYFDNSYKTTFMFGFTAVITIVLSILVFFMGRRAKLFIILMGTICMTYFWFTYVEKTKIYLIYFLFGALSCYSYQQYKIRSKNWQDRTELNTKYCNIYWIINSSITIVLALTMAFAIPLNIKPVTWDWLNNIAMETFPFIVEWRNDALDSYGYGFNSRYNSKAMGYNDKSLGGPVTLNNKLMLEVEGTRFKAPLYLKGVVKDNYSGTFWSKSKSSYKTFNAKDYSPSQYSANVVTNEVAMEIKPKNIITSTILYPFSIYKATYNNNRYFVDTDGEAYFSKLVKRGDKYKIESIMPVAVRDKELKFEDLEKMDKKYLQLPDNISDRVRQLSIDITSKCRNDFDKVKAIENYLRDNYKYTLEPSEIPNGREFTDFFLFEGKEGYCTYFATSMAVLLRASNIPCRYIEGFIVTDECWNGKNYSVNGKNAHAWIEVYFENYGWMQLEPTPAYDTRALEVFQANDEQKQEKDIKTVAIGSTSGLINSSRHKEFLDDDEEVSTSKVHKVKINIKFHIIYIALLVFIFIVIRLVIINVKNKKVHKNLRLTCEMLWYCKVMGIKKEENSTIRNFLKGINKYECSLYITERIVYLFEKLLYSSTDLTSVEQDEIEEFIRTLKNKAIKRIGKIKYVYNLIIVGKQYCQMI